MDWGQVEKRDFFATTALKETSPMLPNDSREGIFQATPVFLQNQGKYIVTSIYTYDSQIPFIVCYNSQRVESWNNL